MSASTDHHTKGETMARRKDTRKQLTARLEALEAEIEDVTARAVEETAVALGGALQLMCYSLLLVTLYFDNTKAEALTNVGSILRLSLVTNPRVIATAFESTLKTIKTQTKTTRHAATIDPALSIADQAEAFVDGARRLRFGDDIPADVAKVTH